MGLTFVTALYDVGRRDPAYTARSCETILDVARRSTLREPVPLVVYTDPEFAAPIFEARRGLEDRTRVEVVPLEALPPWRELARVRALREARPLRNGNPRKDVPGYTLLGWSKLDLIDRTARADPFGNDHVAWVDLGVGHVAHRPAGGLAAMAAAPTTRVSACSMRYVHPSEVADRRAFCGAIRGHVCGGFFGGAATTVTRVVDAGRAEIRAALDDGVVPNDEHVLAMVIARHRAELFRLYFGDYANVLDGYDGVHGAHALVTQNFREALRWRDLDAAVDIGASLLDSVARTDVEFWLELFACAFTVGRHDVGETLARIATEGCLPVVEGTPQAFQVDVARARYAPRAPVA